jgi:hypothetical protein
MLYIATLSVHPGHHMHFNAALFSWSSIFYIRLCMAPPRNIVKYDNVYSDYDMGAGGWEINIPQHHRRGDLNNPKP